jgi:hypothetical protein
MHFHFVCYLTCVLNCGRALEEKRARLGLVECMNHELLQPYPVLHEKQGSQDNLFDKQWKCLCNSCPIYLMLCRSFELRVGIGLVILAGFI